MPILIYMKNPSRVLPIKGSIDPDNPDVVRQYEELYGKGTLVTRTAKGSGIVIPAIADLNIAFLQEVSEKEYKIMEEERKKEIEEAKKRREAESQSGRGLSQPRFAIPAGGLKGFKKN